MGINADAFVNYVIERSKFDKEFRINMSQADRQQGSDCWNIEAKSWKYLMKFCNLNNKIELAALQLIGASITKNHIEQDYKLSLGHSFSSICKNDEEKDREWNSRFHPLISNNTQEDLIVRLRRMLDYLTAKGAKIGYARLLKDIIYWNEDTAKRLAYDFWNKKEE